MIYDRIPSQDMLLCVTVHMRPCHTACYTMQLRQGMKACCSAYCCLKRERPIRLQSWSVLLMETSGSNTLAR